MSEWRFQDSNYASTFAYHQHRQRAPHLEQADHHDRLVKASELVRGVHPTSVSDLGCGDGGLLSLLKGSGIDAWGYDFCPANSQGWAERNVAASFIDVFNSDRDKVRWGQLTVVTEVLEHLDDPHGVLRWISQNSAYVVASSPHNERPENTAHDHHIWGWDTSGYHDLLNRDFEILAHEIVDWSQLILGKSRNYVDVPGAL